ncbi:MAG: SDR family oxidoreductase [Nanoarchaeota archaeon]
MVNTSVAGRFRLDGKVIIITGGAGLLGRKHAEAVAEMGAIPVIWDVDEKAAKDAADGIRHAFKGKALGMGCDITDERSILKAFARVLKTFKKVEVLINNAANNYKVEGGKKQFSRLENFPREAWDQDIAVGLTGAFLCSRVIGAHMAQHGGGVILNIASDLGIIAPDQRIYREEGKAEEEQPVKPVTYSAVKAGLLGLSKYLATYWADKGVRVNAVSFGGVSNNQDEAFVKKLTNLIPLGRMADKDEYKAVVVFLVSDASSYMTGSNLVIDGGRTTW